MQTEEQNQAKREQTEVQQEQSREIEDLLNKTVENFIEFAPIFKRIFMSLSVDSDNEAPKLTSLQYMAVMVLANADDDKVTMNRLATLLKISKQQATKLVDGLAEEKIINRYTNPNNRREVLVELSLMGYDCLAKIRQVKFAQLLDALKYVSAKDMREILTHIEGLNEVFRRLCKVI